MSLFIFIIIIIIIIIGFLFGFVICCINRNLYFPAQERNGNLLKVMGYWLFQKKSKEVTWLTAEDIDFPGILKKEHVEIPGVS